MNQDLPIDLGTFNSVPADSSDTLAAGELLAELRTSAIMPAGQRGEGGEQAATLSVRRIVPCVRRLLRSHAGARRFEVVATAILDHLIQPSLARWRPWLAGAAQWDEDRQRQLRRELAALQPALRRVVSLLEAVRARRDLVADDLFMGTRMKVGGPPKIRARRALQRIRAGIRDDEDGALFGPEKAAILDRRRADPSSEPTNVAGLALSGGGIRSATFSLGIAQVIARRGLFEQVDYLSTVSGGGYLGTFLSSYLATAGPAQRRSAQPTLHRTVFERIFGRIGEGTDTPAVRHLRNNSKYLLAGGWAGRSDPLVSLVIGVATNLLALVPFVVLFVLATWLLREVTLVWGPSAAWVDTLAGMVAGGSPAAIVGAGVVVAAIGVQLLVRPVISFFTRGGEPGSRASRFRSWFESGAKRLTIVAAAAVVFAAIPLLFRAFEQASALRISVRGRGIGAGQWVPLLIAVLPILSGPLANRFRDTKLLGAVVRGVFLVSGPLLLLYLYLVLGGYVFAFEGSRWWILGILFVALGFLWLFMDLNALSPHRYYRDRLAACDLVRQHGDGVEPVEALKLSQLGQGAAAPYHLINACVNLPASKDKDLRGRKGDFFLLSKGSCGSRITGYRRTSDFENWDPGFDVGTAMAVSGAALSSNMATLQLDHLRFFLTLLNVKLGYWAPNVPHLGPIMKAAARVRHKCTPGPDVLLREMFGKMKEHDTFVNLSDGGHIENLGVYELLRRRAKHVISVDGECDPDFVFDGLVKLVRYARIDLGATIDIDLTDLAADEQGYSRAHSALGKITYDDGSIGWLLYVKLSLSGNEALDVLDYRREVPRFPHESTLDQVYDEKQFEAYRALGQHVAEELFREEILAVEGSAFHAISQSGTTDLGKWFKALVRSFRPTGDAVFRSDPTNLEGLSVGISIGASPDFEDARINAAAVSICEALISTGATVVLGHHWAPGGVMSRVAEFAANDRSLNARARDRPVIRHRVEKGRAGQPPPSMPSNLIESAAVAGGLMKLREQITELCSARVCLGGKLERQSGPIPGILDEAWRAARAGQTVLISGALGGAAGWLAQRLQGHDPPTALNYDGDEAMRQGLPASAEALVAALEDRFAQCPPDERALHERLWQTTTLDAARALITELLDLSNNP